METIVLAILFIFGLIFSFVALEVEERIYTVVYLLLATLFFGAILLYVQAVFIGLFYILIYSGLLSVLFASVSHFVEEDKAKNPIISSNGEQNPEGMK